MAQRYADRPGLACSFYLCRLLLDVYSAQLCKWMLGYWISSESFDLVLDKVALLSRVALLFPPAYILAVATFDTLLWWAAVVQQGQHGSEGDFARSETEAPLHYGFVCPAVLPRQRTHAHAVFLFCCVFLFLLRLFITVPVHPIIACRICRPVAALGHRTQGRTEGVRADCGRDSAAQRVLPSLLHHRTRDPLCRPSTTQTATCTHSLLLLLLCCVLCVACCIMHF